MHLPQNSNDDETLGRLLAVLYQAAGSESPERKADTEMGLRGWLIDHLESLGYLEARYGSPDNGEDEDDLFISGITTLGRDLLDLLLRRGPQE